MIKLNKNHHVQLVGFYSVLPLMMQGATNVKFVNAEQAGGIYKFKNIKQKLHKTIAAIWYNKTCREKKT
jgi:hypothetical protein